MKYLAKIAFAPRLYS